MSKCIGKSFVLRAFRKRSAFTLVEVLVATAITLILMASVASIFALVTTGVTDSRAGLEMNDRLRFVKNILQSDLAGITAPTLPPLNPEADLGYFELIEGPIGPVHLTTQANPQFNPSVTIPAVGSTLTTTIGGTAVAVPSDEELDDTDDVLMFTSLSSNGQFKGKWGTTYTQTSPNAEIAWFCRGTNLYRRQLLVVPGYGTSQSNDFSGNTYTMHGFFLTYDASVRVEGGSRSFEYFGAGVGSSGPASASGQMGTGNSPGSPMMGIIKSNSLGDLTKREHRYGHQPLRYPHDARFWGRVDATGGTGSPISGMGLPTLQETSTTSWPFPLYDPPTSAKVPPTGVFIPPTGGAAIISPNATASASSSTSGSAASAPPPSYATASGSGVDPNSYHMPMTASLTTAPMVGMNRAGSMSTSTYTFGASGFTSSLGVYCMQYYAGTRFDDLMLQNVVAFDVKVWDPGAPVFEVAPSTLSGSATSTINESIAPEDPGYVRTLQKFMASPTNITPASTTIRGVTFGSYADLNYMHNVAGVDPYNPIFRTLTSNTSMSTSAASSASFPMTLGSNATNYEHALQAYENSIYTANSAAAPGGTRTYRPLPRPHFAGPGDPRSGLFGLWPGNPAVPMATLLNPTFLATQAKEKYNVDRPIGAVYDTWSTHYERDGLANNLDARFNRFAGTVDPLYNGIDDDGINGVDDPNEVEAPPPYPHPLRGIKIRIRVFEPDTKQVRDVTLSHEFLPE
ncbi:MAG TPA: prepilin-type N-terminal cleavage/methylation domain-containing protein [Pirellulales bacterium]|nr:prepilin-type N-terminal cleavage/methylation domain-containing protein [Pirellulales bacterium]